MGKRLIHFDWAMKKLLRDKANYGVLEGFLSELLKFDLKIKSILESEGNQKEVDDKYNRVDILVENTIGELIIIEVQNDSEVDYFHRMMYGVGKLISQYIEKGKGYGNIKKVYSINIVYFNLGQGKDYIYEYQGHFVGTHLNDVLAPNSRQKLLYSVEKIADIFPKYFVLKINNFNDVAKDSLDQWIYFLKNSEVKSEFDAKGMDEAREKLRYEGLSKEEKEIYERFEKNKMIQQNVEETREMIEQEYEARKKEISEGKKEISEGKKEISEGKKEISEGKKKLEQENKRIEKEKQKIAKEKKEIQQREKQLLEEKNKIVIQLIKGGMTDKMISDITGRSFESIKKLRKDNS